MLAMKPPSASEVLLVELVQASKSLRDRCRSDDVRRCVHDHGNRSVMTDRIHYGSHKHQTIAISLLCNAARSLPTKFVNSLIPDQQVQHAQSQRACDCKILSFDRSPSSVFTTTTGDSRVATKNHERDRQKGPAAA